MLEADDVAADRRRRLGGNHHARQLLALGRAEQHPGLERFEFDPTTSEGRFDARLRRGTLAVVSGRIAKKSPQAMTVRTPSAVLGVRGTEFVVSVDE